MSLRLWKQRGKEQHFGRIIILCAKMQTIRRSSAINARIGTIKRTQYCHFHSSGRIHVAIGDAIPDVELMEHSPGNKVSLANALKGRGVIIGVPAAFSPSCSATHVPGYIKSPKLKDAGLVFVVRYI
jgi:hypothetical protein